MGPSVELQWRVPPLLDRLDRGVVQQRLGSKYTDVIDAAVGADRRFEDYDAFFLCADRALRVTPGSPMEQRRRFALAAYADRFAGAGGAGAGGGRAAQLAKINPETRSGRRGAPLGA